MIIWLTGQPGSGKTTIANELAKELPSSIVIDGDEIRNLFQNTDYSTEGRYVNIRRAQDLALFLQSKGFTPVVSLVSPFLFLREEFKAKTKVFEIYCKCSSIRGREKFFVDYEVPQMNYLTMDTTDKKIVDSVIEIKRYMCNAPCL